MQRQIYVNIPVKDLAKTNAFFTALGFEFNANYSNEQATCMIVGENIFVMLLQEAFFKTLKISLTQKSLQKYFCESMKQANKKWMNLWKKRLQMERKTGIRMIMDLCIQEVLMILMGILGRLCGWQRLTKKTRTKVLVFWIIKNSFCIYLKIYKLNRWICSKILMKILDELY